MSTGTVKWFDPAKGYGFIAPDNGSRDIFVHITAVTLSGLGELREGQKVSFELVIDRKTGSTKAGALKLC
ncbi:cold-shock protein [Labrys neptuniae]|uniref:cold-shock protein n=1 Tax=Labrys neptuniae TaxID=376174 RepID=UPI00288C8687|nr:cold-shock protein [Labrys neptuniae]MDT3382078.1 cold-shock protein [Labrys neptuniae]